jgi:hypothetical protein
MSIATLDIVSFMEGEGGSFDHVVAEVSIYGAKEAKSVAAYNGSFAIVMM